MNSSCLPKVHGKRTAQTTCKWQAHPIHKQHANGKHILDILCIHFTPLFRAMMPPPEKGYTYVTDVRFVTDLFRKAEHSVKHT